VAKTASGSIAALLQRTHADAVGLVEANSLVNIETLGRELSMDVMYGKADSPACRVAQPVAHSVVNQPPPT